jgi:hypothetical protein
MTKLQWDKSGQRVYETGVDHGVLYLQDEIVVPWNGLISVVEGFSNDDAEPYYIDGVKYLDSQKTGDYNAVVRAFTYPPELDEYDGVGIIDESFSADGQPIKPFTLSYRTLIGTDTQDAGYAYKIHIIYGCVAVMDVPTYTSLGDTPDALQFSWKVFAIPELIGPYKPTAHLIIDSRYMNPYLLSSLETMLYGNDTQDAGLPDLDDLVDYVANWDLIEIRNNGDGTWTATGPSNLVYMLDDTAFQIDGIPVVWLEPDKYQIATTTEVSGG